MILIWALLRMITSEPMWRKHLFMLKMVIPSNQLQPLSSDYVLLGLSDPIHFGTDGIDQMYPDAQSWTEATAEIPPGDRRMNANCGSFTINAGQKQRFDYVRLCICSRYVAGRQSESPVTDLVNLIADYVNQATAAVDTLPGGVFTSVKNQKTDQVSFNHFPNPANSSGTIQGEIGTNAQYVIYDLLGHIIQKGKLTKAIILSIFPVCRRALIF